ncbi:hypothetical protein M0802_003207 [Mischocyttarus mexicanus]|nr:hypothetical protein M0802_003207 [Mischocyttarus mexicanus]
MGDKSIERKKQSRRSRAYKAKEEGKVVVYTTSSGIVRLTFYNCMKVKQILNTHMVKYEEKDLFRSAELQTELRDRIGCTAIQVPQLFVGGQYIGDADIVERLNESGVLRGVLKPYQHHHYYYYYYYLQLLKVIAAEAAAATAAAATAPSPVPVPISSLVYILACSPWPRGLPCSPRAVTIVSGFGGVDAGANADRI